ncbi:MAG TPA: sodium-translocating pyrophosphatase [Acidimicrobiales bacterium]|nr:sodium-translocating pyrophosphatase [Acidimicrobiales bacterium]
MNHTLVAEGGYQAFHLGGADWAWLVIALAAGVIGIAAGLVLMRGVLAADTGTAKMREIAKSIQEGAEAFLKRQFRTILIIVVPLAVLIFFTATKVTRPDGTVALSFAQAGIYRVICFLFGAAFSGLTGFIGMSIAVRGNVRTAAAAAKGGKMAGALQVAFRTGAVTGMLCVGLGLLGATAIVMIFQNSATAVLIGFAFGASLLALFMRVGGGIFTKAADVGADLVGKVEAGIPEDDPRNAATIADNVGDNVGDCAGMAADLFESYEITIISSLILGYSAFRTLPGHAFHPTPAILYPLIVPAIGIVASVIGVYTVRARNKDRNAMAPINRGFWLSAVLTVIGALFVAEFYVHDMKVFWAVLTGVVLALVASQITEQFTSTERSPVKEIAESARTGPATTVLSGIAIGLESSVWAIIAIAIALGVAIGLGGGNIEYSLYLVALIGIGLLATTGMVVSEDSFGPVSDNAAGVAEMSGEFTGEAERIMVSLDAVGNTTKAITKGVAIGSAVIAAVALFASFIETIGEQLPSLKHIPATKLFHQIASQVNVANPTTFIGLLIGGSIAFLFSALAIRAVGRSAGTVVQEVRRQFREHPGIMDYSERPEYGRVISICTAAAQRELATPALLAILAPVIVGFGINYLALGAFLAGAILTGQLMANTLSNSGGAWDNAKKFIEDGHEGGKGSEAHKAAVIGDTVGDPFKDTAGPALNPMIKVMNLVSLLVLPAVITLRHNDTARFAIAAAALVVLLAAIAFSKRKASSMDADLPPTAGATPIGSATPATAVGAD